MENNSFDQQIDALYQQRKQLVTAPKINLEQLQKDKKQSKFYKLIMFILFGTISSFAVMAFIAYLGTSDSTKHSIESVVTIDIDSVEVTPVPKTKVLKNISVPLPQMQSIPQMPPSVVQERKSSQSTNDDPILNKLQLKLPSVEIDSTLPQPIYKEMPSYPVHQLMGNNERNVKLSYRINAQGKVFDIKIETGNKHDTFADNAKHALQNWRYMPNSNYNKRLEVEFEFTPD